jgi:hypothetical protein
MIFRILAVCPKVDIEVGNIPSRHNVRANLWPCTIAFEQKLPVEAGVLLAPESDSHCFCFMVVKAVKLENSDKVLQESCS